MDIFIVSLIILGLLAVTDLTVGVANDAVNFLNAGVGSRAGSYKKILFVAALGVLVGVLFSSGMMDIAKSGIFNPQYFVFYEVLIIFVAVMFTDLLLLDLFNTFGLPTSTTVSVVSGMFGGALVISILKIHGAGEALANVAVYLNVASLFKIFTAILLSIAFAFIFGFLVQYITRLIFTFDYKQRFRRYGAIWAGISITILSYFILMKGAKGARFLQEIGVTEWIFDNIGLLLISSLVFWTVIFQLIMLIFKNANILKFIVLLGTFALAMAFAANDLVNFIGPTLAAITAYFIAVVTPDVGTANMADLANSKVQAETWMLLFAGGVMVVTLYFSKKTRTVIQTSVGLGRQSEGEEYFDSNMLARSLVKMVISFVDIIKKITPIKLQDFVQSRFNLADYKPDLDENGNAPAFDLLRASVILIVSSGLISFATSLKLPLSTTYVTFIVAMAAALPDKAWGRDSAVYRVAGVVTVITGWFFTAFLAALTAATIALIIYYSEIYGLLGLVIFTSFVLIRTAKIHKDKENERNIELNSVEPAMAGDSVAKTHIKSIVKDAVNFIDNIVKISTNSYLGLTQNDLKILKKFRGSSKKLNKKLNLLIKNTVDYIKNDVSMYDAEPEIISIVSLCQDMADKVITLTEQNFAYIDNNHHKLFEDQLNDIIIMTKEIENFSKIIEKGFKADGIISLDELISLEKSFNDSMKLMNKNQINRIRKMPPSMKRNILMLNILNDVQGLGSSMIKIAENLIKLNLRVLTSQVEK
ncbi:MAG: inorganic phosphate transporter [Candidatus Kapabacteria bacterium]|nr:inorganic phosphate transporter [Ignavibacteriota bacterium]MCW5884631.1 inorganic phosphate transporter [Candidatus Kapabacteria bacterium]